MIDNVEKLGSLRKCLSLLVQDHRYSVGLITKSMSPSLEIVNQSSPSTKKKLD